MKTFFLKILAALITAAIIAEAAAIVQIKMDVASIQTVLKIHFGNEVAVIRPPSNMER